MTFAGEQIYWTYTTLWWALPMVGFFVVVATHHYVSAYRWVCSLVDPSRIKDFFSGASQLFYVLRWATFCVTFFFLCVALCRPQWGKTESVITRDGRDVIVLLDISRSMQASDILPSRLDAAKLKLKILLSKLTCERLGLILFSGSAFVQSPLTVDYHAFMGFLDQVDTELIASGTTAVDKALVKAVELFESGSSNSSSKIILLVTDGEDFSAHLDKVEARVKKANINVVALGVGSQDGAPIPLKDYSGRVVGYEKDHDGKPFLSKLNAEHLQKIVSNLGGTFIQYRESDADLDGVVAYIQSHEKQQFDERKVSFAEERYPIAVGCAALMYALHTLI